MIDSMLRHTFVLYGKTSGEFMSQLQELGVVDITAGEWDATDQQRQAMAKAEEYKGIYHQMKAFKAPPSCHPETPPLVIPSAAEGPQHAAAEAVELFTQARQKRDELQLLRAQASAELSGLEPWGEFDAKLLERLDGVVLRFFEVPEKQYREVWEQEYPLREVSRLGGAVYFVLAQYVGDEDYAAVFAARELLAPKVSYRQKLGEIEGYDTEIQRQEELMGAAAMDREAVWSAYLELTDRLQLDRATGAGELHVDGHFKLVEGWSAAADRDRVEELARQEAVYYESHVARAEDNPPIKLKNSFFPRLFELIGSLYMKPKYDELDLTPYFAPFYMVFFGMCLGDAGYGALFLLFIGLFWRKIPRAYRPVAWLAVFLSFSTVCWGLLTGNAFGIELAKVESLARFREYFVATENMFYVALGLGGVQILAGQTIKIFNRIKKGGGFVHGLGQLGWVILLYTGVAVFVGDSLGVYVVPKPLLYSLLGVAGGLIFFLNTPGKNPLVNFGVGLYDCYSMATGLLGDLMSYIRLFALALSGSIIAQVFNALADGMGLSVPVPGLNWLLFLIILLVGHGLTIFVSVLGAFVHPVRLTFVEFYKNAGFEGGGREFTPLRRTKQVK